MNSPLVDVIVPVFNQPDLVQQCILSLINGRSSAGYEIIVINDCSTDPSIRPLLETLELTGEIKVHSNDRNLGFTRTVNLGMKMHPNRDVVLLNSDTIVYPGWLDRLQRAALSRPDVATANPMTNQSGSHISCYPALEVPYKGELEVSDAELDRIAATANSDVRIEVHTSVGFCMYIRRKALDAVGFFDQTKFPVAYGEETDFCYRARKAGWAHLVAADVFVTHLEGKSFNERKALLMSDMLATFAILHPEFPVFDREFIRTDPVRKARFGIDCGRLKRMLGTQTVIPVLAAVDAAPQSRPVWLRLDYLEGTAHFEAEGVFKGSLPNLGTFTLPSEIVGLNAALNRIGVVSLDCISPSSHKEIRDLTSTGHPDEIGLSVSLN